MPLRGPHRYTTADAFLVRPGASQPAELVRGEIRVMTPAGGAHGAIAGTIFAALHAFVEPRDLGICFPDNTGFLLPGLGDTVRSPDVAFVRADRLPERGLGAGWMTVAPDLVVEVLSPTETPSELEEKLRDYKTAGTRLVWVVDPATRIVSVRTANGESLLREGNELDGGDVLPGFALAITQLFARLAR
jgi:Uma2 family endonuclease